MAKAKTNFMARSINLKVIQTKVVFDFQIVVLKFQEISRRFNSHVFLLEKCIQFDEI